MKRRAFLSAAVFTLSILIVLPAMAAEKIRIACVGDSITFGAGVRNRTKNCYPVVLGNLLGDGYDVRNFGVNAATLLKKGDKPYWKLGAFKNATEFKPNIVIIKLGTNDSKPQNWKNKGEFANDLKAMVDHFSALSSKPKIWLCKPVPVYKDRWGITETVVKGEVIPQVEAVAKEKKLSVIDLYSAMSDSKKMFPDGIHPNIEGAKKMAEFIKETIAKK